LFPLVEVTNCYLNRFLVSQPVQVDQLNESKVLYDLHQINGVSRIAVANWEIDLFAGLEEGGFSRGCQSASG
jgi:hypothetical protein